MYENYFGPPDPEEGPQYNQDIREQLHICPEEYCGSEFVQPVTWEPINDTHHLLLCRCPECGWEGKGEHPNYKIEVFDETLEKGTFILEKALGELTRENMKIAADQFEAALEADAIQPEDF